MNTGDFDYNLPPELIAQTPIPIRDQSRLMCLDKTGGEVEHRRFFELTELLRPGDCLVLNSSRVIPARLIGTRAGGGEAELLLLRDEGENTWTCLARPGRRLKTGARVVFGGGVLTGEIIGVEDNGDRRVRFSFDGQFDAVIESLGKMPLPPYIKQQLTDNERYQTVYSAEPGSAAAPTAGLHFTTELLEAIRARGVKIAQLILHVGVGTFRPVKEDVIENHEMHSEYCVISNETAELINETKRESGRVIAVGTTSCRALESFTDGDGVLKAGSGWTDIFIYPGYEFRCIDALVTNFHLPMSTLIMLVSALAGRENVLNAYRIAVEERYRFFSFGDAMFIH